MGCGFRFSLGNCGCAPPPPCGQVCFGVLDCFGVPLNGALVTLKKSGVAVASDVTANDGGISRISVVNGGSGYTSAPTVTISGGGGSGATATATFGGFPSKVTGIQITNRGSGYTSNPTVTISGGGGSGATANGYTGGSVCIPITSAGTYSYVVTATGYTTFTSSTFAATCDTNYAFPTLTTTNGKICVTVHSCLFGLVDTGTVAGVTVNLSQSGTLKATGTTDSSGVACIIVPPGSYDVSADDSGRFTFDTTTASSQACITNEARLTGSGATGFHCFGTSSAGDCSIPVADTLTLTDSFFGATTIAWNDTGTLGAGWYGSLSAAIDCAGCSGTVTINYYLSADGKLTAMTPNPSVPVCASGTGFSDRNPSSLSCPPSFVATWTGGSFGSLPWCDVVTITVTE